MKKQNLKGKSMKGITLIALVITIIVLLILSGVSIATLTGENGILSQAEEATRRTKVKEAEEKIKLAGNAALAFGEGKLTYDNFTDELDKEFGEGNYTIVPEDSTANEWTVTVTTTAGDATVIIKGKAAEPEEPGELNWEEILANATSPHPDQTESNDIGIGTDGQLVNLDLWGYGNDDIVNYETHYNGSTQYGQWQNTQGGGYNLLKESVSNRYYTSYYGDIIGGKIEGKVPAYIKRTTDSEFIPVTDMLSTFETLEDLVYAPEIPETVTRMGGTFYQCTGLKEVTLGPNVTMILNYWHTDNWDHVNKWTKNSVKIFDGITGELTVKVPENSTTHSLISEAYGSSPNITIVTY